MLELFNISKSYGPVHVLHDISLRFLPGEIMAIVGPSGAGKTTLLQIAGTLDRPDSGKVLFDNTDLLKLKDKRLSKFRNQNIGFIFQFHQLMQEFSAIENVALPALIAGRKRKESFAEAGKLLEELGMGHRLSHKPSELSGGEKQRTAIARALINHPAIVFADEPTGSLDSKNRDEIKDIITGLRDKYGQTFVVVTHDPTMAEIADRRVMMVDGRISEDSASDMSEDLVNFAEPDSSGLHSETKDIQPETSESERIFIGDIFDYSMEINKKSGHDNEEKSDKDPSESTKQIPEEESDKKI